MKTEQSQYLNWQGLERIKRQSPEQGLEKAAEQFEAMFLQMVLKNMRSATDALRDPDSPFAPGPQQAMMRDWHDGQIAMNMASQGQTGLRELMVNQLGGQLKSAAGAVVNNNETSLAAFSQPLRVAKNG
ncbi:rod-binding protein [Oceanimonas sp. CHS3-5]|uniref:rod-binding protein n=1 Tax=Oceanimonas sp. CHS3-5 TaxID=3068186 RepID=UPI00273EFB21|nr:rod-binding protein [Oceanimonas sp. CHS3-5]MDP5292383.1 rod-binding protein [Oceanimonas sp. CHS3-5]